MSCAERAALPLLLLASGCTLLNRVDTCDAPREPERQVNAGSTGDQFTMPARSLVQLPGDRLVAAWISEPGAKADSPSQLVATLVTADGATLACGRPSHEVQISTAADEVVHRFAVAVSPAEGSAVYFAWHASPAGAGGSGGGIFARLMRQDLCDFTVPPRVLRLSDPSEDGRAPSVAVRSDGREALVAWVTGPSGSWLNRIRSRPVGVVTDAFGAPERNACDGSDAPCQHAHVALATAPAITAFREGYALAWAQSRDTILQGMEVRVQLLGPDGRPLIDATSPRPYGPVEHVDLALAATADEVFLAHAGLPRAGFESSGDAEVFLERFAADGGSAGSPARVNDAVEGRQRHPALAVTPRGAVFVAWITEGLEADNGAWARALDERGRPRFSGLACDVSDFRLGPGAGERQLAVSLVADEQRLTALFTDERKDAPTGDADGQSVWLRRFELDRLFPASR